MPFLPCLRCLYAVLGPLLKFGIMLFLQCTEGSVCCFSSVCSVYFLDSVGRLCRLGFFLPFSEILTVLPGSVCQFLEVWAGSVCYIYCSVLGSVNSFMILTRSVISVYP